MTKALDYYVSLTVNKLSTNMSYTPFIVTPLKCAFIDICANVLFWLMFVLVFGLNDCWPPTLYYGLWHLKLFELEVCSYVADIFLVGGPSGSGKTSLAHKMANIVGCEVVSLERYYKSEQVKDFKYDDFSSLDLSLLSKVRLWFCLSCFLISFVFFLSCKFVLYEMASQFIAIGYV